MLANDPERTGLPDLHSVDYSGARVLAAVGLAALVYPATLLHSAFETARLSSPVQRITNAGSEMVAQAFRALGGQE